MDKRYKASFILVALVLVTLTAGCCISSRTGIDTAADPIMGDVDAALAGGPVFIEFGAPWCQYCVEEKPIIEELKKEYTGVTFMDVNTDENNALPDAFYVGGIPQMNLIVKKNPDGSYLYADVYGKTTGDRKRSAIIGFTEKADLKTALDAALQARS
jgi:thioredoxin 1